MKKKCIRKTLFALFYYITDRHHIMSNDGSLGLFFCLDTKYIYIEIEVSSATIYGSMIEKNMRKHKI